MAEFKHLETDTGTNVDISGVTAIGSYTATADKLVMCDVSIDAVAGDGDYIMYVKRQIGGSGSSYVILPKTTLSAASGETAISGQSGWITVRDDDVLTVYVDGLAGDTATPDWTTRWFELAGVTAAAVADAVWDEAIADHTTSTAFGGKNQKVVPSETIGDYKADVSALALASDLQDVEDKIDLLDTNSVMSFTIDGFTLEQIVQIMAASLAGKLTRTGNTLTFRDLADTLDRIIAETDANKQRTNMNYGV